MDTLAKVKCDSAQITAGIQDIAQKIQTLSGEPCDNIEALRNFLVEINTLRDELKSLNGVMEDNIYRQNQLISEGEAAAANINQQIATAEKSFGVSVFNESQAAPNGFAHSEATNKDDALANGSTTSEESDKISVHDESTELNGTEDDLMCALDLLNKSLPKLL